MYICHTFAALTILLTYAPVSDGATALKPQEVITRNNLGELSHEDLNSCDDQCSPWTVPTESTSDMQLLDAKPLPCSRFSSDTISAYQLQQRLASDISPYPPTPLAVGVLDLSYLLVLHTCCIASQAEGKEPGNWAEASQTRM